MTIRPLRLVAWLALTLGIVVALYVTGDPFGHEHWWNHALNYVYGGSIGALDVIVFWAWVAQW